MMLALGVCPDLVTPFICQGTVHCTYTACTLQCSLLFNLFHRVMAADQPPQDVLAIAFLVESSLDVAQEWRKRILNYFAVLLKRLVDCHPTSKVCLDLSVVDFDRLILDTDNRFQSKVAFVCYGPGDHTPSPILCKRFFTDQQSLFMEMADADVSRLGVGMTNSGGTKGMAALEGFVSVLEVR